FANQNFNVPDASKSQIETSQKQICVVLLDGHSRNQRVPNVLIARVQSDSRSEREVVKNLYSPLVLNGSGSRRESIDIVFEFAADDVVVEPHAETVILPAVRQTAGKQSKASIASERICPLGCIPQPPERSNSA